MISDSFSRRRFLVTGAATVGAGLLPSRLAAAEGDGPLYKISLAQWSLHRTLFDGKLEALDFPVAAKRDFGIDAVEYVNQFFKDKAKDEAWLGKLKTRCEDHGVSSLLIMCDGEGALGDPDEGRRAEAVDNHKKWVEAAKFLGCHSIRVNASSSGSFEEQQKLAADGLAALTEFAEQHEINVLVENHGGLSSNGEWLAGTIKRVGMDHCGTLPDFGNFRISNDEEYDRYEGVKELMPYAKGVSAKSHDFDDDGNEVHTDYRRMMKIVLDAGYHGHVGVEYEGGDLSEAEGINATKALLEKVRAELA